MTFETTAAGNKNGSTRPKGTNCLSLHDRTSLPVFFVGQYTGKCGRLQYGIFNKNRREAGGGLHVSTMTNKNADAGLGVLRAKWRRTFQPRFRMRRRRGGVCKAASAVPQAHFFLSCQKLQCSAPFSLRGKEKAAGGKKKTAKGELRSEQTPHPSSCPPLAADRRRPFRCSSFSHTNRFAGFAWEPCPLCKPLKTTKKGAAAPFLGSSPGLGLCGDRFRLAKRDADASLIDRRGYRNTLRLFQL